MSGNWMLFLVNKIEIELSKSVGEDHLTEILREIQATPKEYWLNLLQMMRVFRESVTFKPEFFNHSQLEIDAQQKILNQQHQLLKELSKEWLEKADFQDFQDLVIENWFI